MFVVIGSTLAACGGGSGTPTAANSPSISTTDPTVIVPKTVTYAVDLSNGCLQSHNADTAVKYLLGDKQAEYLLWHCADHMTNDTVHDLRRVLINFRFDYNKQCYTEVATHMDFSNCTGVIPPPPANPSFGVRVKDFKVARATNDQGLSGFSYVATIENTGNIPMMDVSYRIDINQTLGGSTGPLDILDVASGVPAQTVTANPPAFSPGTSGQKYTLDLTLTDIFGQPLLRAPRRTSITLP